jgi:signal transduction histidine kinase
MPDQAGKIFQPNFTTKSSGMGLGLAIVRSIILSSGGEITFESHPGVKTIFYIYLPVIDENNQD